VVEKPANYLSYRYGADAYCRGILYLPGTCILISTTTPSTGLQKLPTSIQNYNLGCHIYLTNLEDVLEFFILMDMFGKILSINGRKSYPEALYI
jgi:hypothetical protein